MQITWPIKVMHKMNLKNYKLAKDIDYREELGLKGREWIKRTHDPKDVAQRHIDIWESIV